MKIFNLKSKLYLLLLMPILLMACGSDDDVATVVLSSISVSPSTVSAPLPVGLSYQFTATGTYSDGSKQDLSSSATWTSSDTGVATVDANGLAIGAAAGTTNISASQEGVTSNAVGLTVANPNLLSITVTPATVPNPLPEGRTANFYAEGLFDNNQAYDITNYVVWNSTDVTKATITQTGIATAVAAGTTNISASTVTPALVSNVVVLTVSIPAPESVNIEPEVFPTLPLGRDKQFVAFLRYDDGSQYNITSTATWTSADTNIARVNNDIDGEFNGTVTGVDIGETQIIATDNNTGLADTIHVSVVKEEITGVILKPAGPVDVPLTYTQSYTAEGTFSDGINRRLGDERAWTLSDTSLATFTFNNTGFLAVVEGVATGSVDVTYEDVLANGSRTGVSGSSTLNVGPAVLKAITIIPNIDFSMPVNVVQAFDARGEFTDGSLRLITSDVTWVSDNLNVGVFGPESGKLTAVAASGSTGVLATQDGISSPTVTVTANAETLVTITIGPRQPERVPVGDTVQLTARGTYTDGSIFDIATEVNWESSDPAIVTVSNITGEKGKITGVTSGFAVITATDPRTSVTDTEDVIVLP